MSIVYNQNNNMALAISIEDLLKKQRIKSVRMEFRMGRNLESICHSVYAFANDCNDLGGGFILAGPRGD